MGLTTFLRLGVPAVLAAAMAACTVSTSDGGGWSSAGGAPTGVTSDGGVAPTGPAVTLLATVDPNVTMNAQPGQGIGVFTEYDAGGHWHVWWTCDTAITQELCAFDVGVSTAGAITNASADQFSSADTLSTPVLADGSSLEARTTTTLTMQGIFFDTAPGATITLSATIGGIANGQFLFWVQAGKINDGYAGTVTDPLMLKGASP